MALILTPSSCTNSGNNTASTAWTVQVPAQVPGDLIICHLVSDADVTHGTLPGGPNGETAVILEDARSDGAAGVRVSVWYWIATGTNAAGSRIVTPSATEQWQATVVRIPSGSYDSATPLQYSNNYLAGSSAAIVSPTLVPARAGARPIFWAGIDADTVTGISQQAGTTWTLLANVDVGAVTGVLAYRENLTAVSATVTSGNLSGASDNYVSVGYLVYEHTTVTPQKGALTLTGRAPTVEQRAPPAGHFLSGPLLGLGYFGSPVTISNQSLTPVKGTLTLGGQVATLTQPQSASPAKGVLTLTGYAPTVTQAANQAVTPVKGTLTLTGTVATVAQTANQAIAAVVGHLTATGYAPGMVRTANQTAGPPAVGHLTLTGQQATLSQPQSATPTKGSLSLTGHAPAVTQGDSKILEPAAGRLTLGGQVPALTQPQSASPSAGSLTLTGYAPQLVQTTPATPAFISLPLLGLYFGASAGSVQATPSTGHLTLTGRQPTIIAPASVTPTVGHLTLTGRQATVGNQEVLIEWDDLGQTEEGYRVKWGTSSGSYAWSADVGADTTSYEIKGLTYGVTYYVAVFALVGGVEQETSAEMMFTAGLWHVPATGHLSLGGKVPTVVQGGAVSLTPTVGHLTLGGKQPALTQPRSLTPSSASLTLTGYAPAVTQALLVAPGAGALTLTGYTPTLTQPRSLDPNVGHLSLSGRQPSVEQSRVVSPAAGSLALTGYVPAVAQTANQVLEPVAASLTLTGYAPAVGLVGSIVVAPEAGALRLRGYVPLITGPTYPRTGAGGVVGGGRGRKPKRVIWVEPDDDGPVVEVESAADVPKAVKAIKRQAKAIAKAAIANREPIPELPQWVVHGEAPFAAELRRRIREIEANFAYVYQLMLIEQRRREDEDDEDVLLLI